MSLSNVRHQKLIYFQPVTSQLLISPSAPDSLPQKIFIVPNKAKWKRTVCVHAKLLHKKRIDLITTDDILEVLKPIWLKTPVAAKDVRQQLETIFAAAKARNKRSAENPALWKGHLEHLLPKTKRKGKVRGPHKSMAYEELPTFIAELALAVTSPGAQSI
jgi:hypothetical protein